MIQNKEFLLIQNLLNQSKIVALPTETVYGFAINYDDEIALKNLYTLKKRKEDKPIAVMVSQNYDLNKYFEINYLANKIIKKFLPGPITIILKIKDKYPYQTHLGTNLVGIRMPKDKYLQNLLSFLDKPIQVTSANISNKLPYDNYLDVVNNFKNNLLIGKIIKGKCKSKIPTTVIDLSEKEIKILREGEIKADLILKEIEK